MAAARYVLTRRAEHDLQEARTWSLARWGEEVTEAYFEALHRGAQLIAEHHDSISGRLALAAGTGLLIYPVRHQYLVFEPLNADLVVIVAVIRQGRDIPRILRKWAAPIRQELGEVRELIAKKKIRVKAKPSPKK
jgi:plasmid stabilization system protein ParE